MKNLMSGVEDRPNQRAGVKNGEPGPEYAQPGVTRGGVPLLSGIGDSS